MDWTPGRICASSVHLIPYSKVPASSEVTSRDPDGISGPAQPGVPPTSSQTACGDELQVSVTDLPSFTPSGVAVMLAAMPPVPLSVVVKTVSAVTVSVPVRAYSSVGLNVTLATQVAFTASDVPQLCSTEKSPVAVIEAMVAGPVPLFLRVMEPVFGVLYGVTGKIALPGENEMYGASGGLATDCPSRTTQARKATTFVWSRICSPPSRNKAAVVPLCALPHKASPSIFWKKA